MEIAPEHINGGFTYTHTRNKTIFVFRREEFPKVFVHETLHHTPLDSHSQWSSANLQKIYKYFHIDMSNCNRAMQCHTTDVRPNEAWVETWAEIYHLLFIQYEYNLPWSFLWKAEREWACVQAKRVLLLQKAQPHGTWRERTHAFSYMVLRAALLWHAPHLLQQLQTGITWNASQLTQRMIASYENPTFKECLRRTRIPSHSSFRMTVFGDL